MKREDGELVPVGKIIGGLSGPEADNKFIVRNFRQNVLRELKKIKLAWPGLNYSTAPGVLILWPSTPAIPPAEQLQLVE